MSWAVLLEISDCANRARIPYATVTDGVSTFVADANGHFLALIEEDGYAGYGLQVSAANYAPKVVDVYQIQNGQTVAVCLDHLAAPPPPPPPPGPGPGW